MRMNMFAGLLSSFKSTNMGFDTSSTGGFRRGTTTQDIWDILPNVNRPTSPSVVSDVSDSASIMSDAVSSIFDTTSDLADDASAVSSMHSSDPCDDLSGKLLETSYESDSEDADREDYLNECFDCQDCVITQLARHALIHGYDTTGYKHVHGTGSLALADSADGYVPARYAERDPSYSPRRHLAAYPTPIGLRPYELRPLPIGEGRPIRSPSQGQNSTTHNVTKPVTSTIYQPAEGKEFHFNFTLPANTYGYNADIASEPLRVPRLWALRNLPLRR